ncbi:hypothetical protein CIP107528_01385 [Corynebacterium diphtheriae]|nr:hypothetical protein CIP107528_01385 [Corynebacterium diphtheriae]
MGVAMPPTDADAGTHQDSLGDVEGLCGCHDTTVVRRLGNEHPRCLVVTERDVLVALIVEIDGSNDVARLIPPRSHVVGDIHGIACSGIQLESVFSRNSGSLIPD